MRTFLGAVIVALVAGLVGCQRSAAPPGEPPQASKEPVKPATSAVSLKVGDAQALADLIASHKGKVVFVDFWATWCHPCVEYFPHTVELHRQHAASGLATISVSFDAAEELEKARAFLAEQGADFDNLLSRYEPGPEAFEAFQIDQVPHFRLYDRQGKLRYKWDEKPADADAKIKELLAESAS